MRLTLRYKTDRRLPGSRTADRPGRIGSVAFTSADLVVGGISPLRAWCACWPLWLPSRFWNPSAGAGSIGRTARRPVARLKATAPSAQASANTFDPSLRPLEKKWSSDDCPRWRISSRSSPRMANGTSRFILRAPRENGSPEKWCELQTIISGSSELNRANLLDPLSLSS